MVVLRVTWACHCQALEAFLGTLVNVCLVSLAGVAIQLTLMLSWWPLHMGSMRSGMQDSKLWFVSQTPKPLRSSSMRMSLRPILMPLCWNISRNFCPLIGVWASLIRCERVIPVLIGWPSKGLLVMEPLLTTQIRFSPPLCWCHGSLWE